MHFIFKNGADIPRKWRNVTVGEFWSRIEAEPPGTYFKQADITQKIASLIMLVPEELLV